MKTYISADGILVNDIATCEISSSLYNPPLRFTIIDSKICPLLPIELKLQNAARGKHYKEQEKYLLSELKLDSLNIANSLEKFKQNAMKACTADSIPNLITMIMHGTSQQPGLNEDKNADNEFMQEEISFPALLPEENYLNSEAMLADTAPVESWQEPETSIDADNLDQPSNKKHKTEGSRQLNSKHSNYLGIKWLPEKSRWKAYLFFKGSLLISKKCRTEEEAVTARNKAITDYMESHNLTQKERDALQKKSNIISPTTSIVQNKNYVSEQLVEPSSHYRGVSWNKQKNRWRAYLLYKHDIIIRKQFETEEQAATAYNKAIDDYIIKKNLSGTEASTLEKRRNLIQSKSDIDDVWFDINPEDISSASIFDDHINNKDDFSLFDIDPDDLDPTPKLNQNETRDNMLTEDVSTHISHEPQTFVDNDNIEMPGIQQDEFHNPEQNPYKSSRYRGVSWISRRNAWKAYLAYDHKCVLSKSFKTEEEAAIAYNTAVNKIASDNKLSDIARRELLNRINVIVPTTNTRKPIQSRSDENKYTIYRGISWIKADERWRARLYFKSKVCFERSFRTEQEAAMAYNNAILDLVNSSKISEAEKNELLSRINDIKPTVDDSAPTQQKATLPDKIITSTSEPIKPKSSIYRGVSWIKADNRWRARLVYKGKTVIQLYFKTEVEAANAYNQAILKLCTSLKLSGSEEILLLNQMNVIPPNDDLSSTLPLTSDSSPKTLIFSNNIIRPSLNAETFNPGNTARDDFKLFTDDDSVEISDDELYDALQHLIAPTVETTLDKSTGKRPRR